MINYGSNDAPYVPVINNPKLEKKETQNSGKNNEKVPVYKDKQVPNKPKKPEDAKKETYELFSTSKTQKGKVVKEKQNTILDTITYEDDLASTYSGGSASKSSKAQKGKSVKGYPNETNFIFNEVDDVDQHESELEPTYNGGSANKPLKTKNPRRGQKKYDSITIENNSGSINTPTIDENIDWPTLLTVLLKKSIIGIGTLTFIIKDNLVEIYRSRFANTQEDESDLESQ